MEQNPIEREDPNAIKKLNTSDKVKELIAERAKESTEQKENGKCVYNMPPLLILLVNCPQNKTIMVGRGWIVMRLKE